MRLRRLALVMALVAGIGVGAASPAAAVTAAPGDWTSPPGTSARAVVVTGSLVSVDQAGLVAVLAVDVGRRHAQQRPLTIFATAGTAISRRGRPVPLTVLTGARVTVTGKRVGDQVGAAKITG